MGTLRPLQAPTIWRILGKNYTTHLLCHKCDSVPLSAVAALSQAPYGTAH